MLAACVSSVPCCDSLLLPLANLFRLLKPINWLVIWIFLIHGARSDELQKLTNTTYLLDTLLSEDKYDRKIRPGLGGPPLEIYTNVEIRSFGPISESEMVYSMDCYFRQSWSDTRLRFRSHLEKLSMDWKFLQKVWIPDTVFLNGKSSYLHKVTVPNKFIRLGKDGKLSYSMRLTVKASCPMHLRKYPLDTQACPLEIGSFAYTSEDVIYRWSEGSKVILSKDVVLSQYDFVNMTTTHRFNSRKSGDQTDQRSVLVVYFIIQRRRGYFILQIYAPCAMIVGASWVSFWINRSDAAGRVAVGATTVLTMVTMGFGGKREKVPSATAIDWFVIMCFTFVFSALVEYAFVNFIDNYEKLQAKKQMEAEREKKKQEGLEGDKSDNIRSERLRKLRTHIRETYARKKREDALLKRKREQLRKMKEQESQRLRHERRTQRNEERFGKRPQVELPADGVQQTDFLDGNPPVRKKRPAARPQTREEKRKEEEHIRKMQKELQKLVEASGVRFGKQAPTFEGRMSIGKKTYRNRHIASKVDSYARIVFPVTFGVLNIMYWSLFLLILDDEISLPPDAGTYDL